MADWPILNALLNTASGASWVSVHNGGGVGIGYSQHAGQVTVADGTDQSARCLERVMTCDPGIGVLRHVDAGYPEAIEFADQAGLRAPMRRRFMTTLVRGARQLLTLRGDGGPRRGAALRDLGIVANGAVLMKDGIIVAAGPARRIEKLPAARRAREIDAEGARSDAGVRGQPHAPRSSDGRAWPTTKCAWRARAMRKSRRRAAAFYPA